MNWEPTIGDVVKVPERRVQFGTIVGIQADTAGAVYRVKPTSRRVVGSGEPSWRGPDVMCRRAEMLRVPVASALSE